MATAPVKKVQPPVEEPQAEAPAVQPTNETSVVHGVESGVKTRINLPDGSYRLDY